MRMWQTLMPNHLAAAQVFESSMAAESLEVVKRIEKMTHEVTFVSKTRIKVDRLFVIFV